MQQQEQKESSEELKYLKDCPSTNALLASEASNHQLKDGFGYYTFSQTAGRGQQGAKWHTGADNNIALSLCFTPDFLDLGQHFLLTQIISIAVHEFVEEFAAPCTIKWPNDLLLGGRKVAGILIETAMIGNRFQYVIAGVGLNINETTFPKGLNATSIHQVSGQFYNLHLMAYRLADSIRQWYGRLKNGELKMIRREYDSKLYGLGKKINFKLDSARVSGIFSKVDDSGRMVVNFGGREETYQTKEISIILP